MKRELALHLITFLFYFVLVSLLRRHLDLSYWPFWVGGLIGSLMPDLDHLIYVYFLRPYELTSQRVMYEARKGNLIESWNLLASTRSERRDLILHTVIFQIIFVVLSFWVISSGGSLLGRGIVLAFLLHLFVDELIDLRQTGSLLNWFGKNLGLIPDRLQISVYLIFNFAVIVLLGFLV